MCICSCFGMQIVVRFWRVTGLEVLKGIGMLWDMWTFAWVDNLVHQYMCIHIFVSQEHCHGWMHSLIMMMVSHHSLSFSWFICLIHSIFFAMKWLIFLLWITCDKERRISLLAWNYILEIALHSKYVILLQPIIVDLKVKTKMLDALYTT